MPWNPMVWLRRKLYDFGHAMGIDRYQFLDGVARKESTIPSLIGILLLYLCISLFFPLGVAFYYGENVRPWVFPIALTGCTGILLTLRYKTSRHIRPTEAMFIVSFGWLLAMTVGAIPYAMYDMGLLDSLFESMSGFTTTGSSIMANIEAWPLSLLFWRSLTQWLGGAGIIMIFVTVFPMLGVGGRNLAKSEISGGVEARPFSMRIKDEARKFHYIFIGLSVLMVAILLLIGTGFYDSLVVMFSTMSTGGFSPHTASIGYYNALVQWIVIAFMFLGGTSFYASYQALSRRGSKALRRSAEFRAYVALAIVVSLAATLAIWNRDLATLEQSVRTGTFQVVSLLTSTGYATADYMIWDRAIVFALMALIIIGGCTGSTAGGLKIMRILLSWQFIKSTLYKAVHPRALFPVRMDGRPLTEAAVTSVLAVIMCYFITALACTVLLVLAGIEPLTSMSAAITTLSNCGPGLGILGPSGNFGTMPDFAKIVLIFTMWAGRLEFISVLVLMTPAFWRDLVRYREPER